MTNPYENLPFVAVPPKGKRLPTCFWHVTPTGDYLADCETGTAYGLAALRFMRDNDQSYMLGDVVREMIRQGQGKGAAEPNGVVLGFCSVIATVAVAGAQESYLVQLEQYYDRVREKLRAAS